MIKYFKYTHPIQIYWDTLNIIKNIPYALSQLIIIVPYFVYYSKELENGSFTENEITNTLFWRNKDGHLHKEDGPAVIDLKNKKIRYYINGIEIKANNNYDFKKKVKMKAFW